MKTPIIIKLILALFIFSCDSNNEVKNQFEVVFDNTEEKIEKIEPTSNVEIINGEFIEDFIVKDNYKTITLKRIDGNSETLIQQTYFDKKQNITKEIYYKEKGELWYKYIATYLNNGKLKSKTNYDSEGEVESKIKNYYNSKGIQTLSKWYYKNNKAEVSKYSYNNDNQLAFIKEYDETGELEVTYEYIYKDSLLFEINRYYEEGVIWMKNKYFYLENKNRLETTYHLTDGQLIISSSKETDPSGKIVANSYYNKKGKLSSSSVNEYNGYGDMTVFDKNTGYNEAYIDYQYDETGNWIKKTTNQRGQTRIQYKEIEFYD